MADRALYQLRERWLRIVSCRTARHDVAVDTRHIGGLVVWTCHGKTLWPLPCAAVQAKREASTTEAQRHGTIRVCSSEPARNGADIFPLNPFDSGLRFWVDHFDAARFWRLDPASEVVNLSSLLVIKYTSSGAHRGQSRLPPCYQDQTFSVRSLDRFFVLGQWSVDPQPFPCFGF